MICLVNKAETKIDNTPNKIAKRLVTEIALMVRVWV